MSYRSPAIEHLGIVFERLLKHYAIILDKCSTWAMGQEKRDAIVDAAIRIAGERGAAGVTQRAVAAEAGVAGGLGAHSFGGTRCLVAEALVRAGERERERLAEAAPADGADADAWVDALVRHLAIAGDD